MAIQSIGKSTIYVDGKQAESEMKRLTEEVDKYSKKMNEVRKANDKAGFDKAKKEYSAANKELKSYKTTVFDVTKVLNNLSGTSYNTLIKVQRKLEREVKGMNKTTKEEIALYKTKIGQLAKVKEATSKVRMEMAAGAKASYTYSGRMGLLSRTFSNFKSMLLAGGLIGAIYSIGRALSKVISISAEFEKALSSLSAITGAIGADLDFFKQKAIGLSLQSMKSATDIVKAFELVGSVRPELLKNKDALVAVTKQAIILSEATGGKLGVEEAATATAGALNQFTLKAQDAARVTNVLAAGSKYGSAMVMQQTESIKEFGAVADAAGITIEQSVGLIETLAEKQILGSEAGTKLRNIIIKLEGDQKNYKNGVFDMNLALDNLAKSNINVTDLTKMFGKENVVAAQLLLKNREKVISYTEAVTGTNTALEQQAIQNNNLAGSLTKLANAWDTFLIKTNKSNGWLADNIRFITALINKFDDLNAVFTKKGIIMGMITFKETLEEINKTKAKEAAKLFDSHGIIKQSKLSGQSLKELKTTLKDLEHDADIYSNNWKKAKDNGDKEQRAFWSIQFDIAKQNIDLTKKELNVKLNAEKKKKAAEDAKAKAAIAAAELEAKQKAAINKKYQDKINTEKAKETQDKQKELDKERTDDLNALQKKFDDEEKARKTAYYNELAALGTNEKAKKALTTKFNSEEIEAKIKHLNEMVALAENQLKTGGIKALSIENAMLSDEDQQKLKDKITDLKLLIAQLKAEIAGEANTGGKPDPSTEGNTQTYGGAIAHFLFGKDWDNMTLSNKIKAVGDLAIKTLSDINKIISNSENQQLMDFENNISKKKELLNKQLNDGIISYEEYTARTSQLDEELDKKKRKIDHDQAVRAKALAIMSAVLNTAVGVSRVFKDFAMPWAAAVAAIVGALGAVQIGVAASTPVPAYATGNYADVLAQDGKTYHAKTTDSNHQSGLFSTPTYVPDFGLFGETKQPELVFNPYDTQKIMNTPALVDAIRMTIGAQQFAGGNAREIIKENNTITQTFTDPALIELMQDIREYIKEPPRAELVADEDYIRTHNKVKNEYDQFQKRVGM